MLLKRFWDGLNRLDLCVWLDGCLRVVDDVMKLTRLCSSFTIEAVCDCRSRLRFRV